MFVPSAEGGNILNGIGSKLSNENFYIPTSTKGGVDPRRIKAPFC
jgi:hypothetical protein